MAWEDDLSSDLPRGVAGADPKVPSAAWAMPSDIGENWAYHRKAIFLGYRGGKGIGMADDRHVLLCAGSRSGKGISFVIPNLLLYEGSILTIDPKGELARETANRRHVMGQKVVVIDPFNRSGEHTKTFRGGFNPLAEIDPESDEAVDDAAMLAEALVTDDSGADSHWANAARELVKALILRALLEPIETRTLLYVRKFFHAPGKVLTGSDGKKAVVSGQVMALREMAGRAKPDELPGLDSPCVEIMAGIAAAYIQKNEREFNSIVSYASVQLSFLDSRPLAKCLEKSSFKLSELKTGKTTVYLCLPASRMATHGKWFRAVVSQAMLMCENVDVKMECPLLLMLEEFPVLGYMRSIEAAAGQIASFGVKIITIIQDLTQLQKFYKATWETFLGNSGVTIFFGNSDVTTLDYVSKKLGALGFDLARSSGASPSARMAGAIVRQDHLQLSRLLEPHELEVAFARRKLRALVLYSGEKPLVVKRARYFDPEEPFAELML